MKYPQLKTPKAHVLSGGGGGARCPKEGRRVCFIPTPASRALYSGQVPGRGECGTIKSVPLGGRRATCMGGPGGGLVYVDWDRSRFQGVSRWDLTDEKTGRGLAGATAKKRRKRKSRR